MVSREESHSHLEVQRTALLLQEKKSLKITGDACEKRRSAELAKEQKEIQFQVEKPQAKKPVLRIIYSVP